MARKEINIKRWIFSIKKKLFKGGFSEINFCIAMYNT